MMDRFGASPFVAHENALQERGLCKFATVFRYRCIIQARIGISSFLKNHISIPVDDITPYFGVSLIALDNVSSVRHRSWTADEKLREPHTHVPTLIACQG